MIVTTTPTVEGRTIGEYKGIVFGEVISGVDIFRDIGAGLRNIFGGRSSGYEDELQNARSEALAEMQRRASALGADAVVGVDVDYEVLGSDNGMLMVSVSGTAVTLRCSQWCSMPPAMATPSAMLSGWGKAWAVLCGMSKVSPPHPWPPMTPLCWEAAFMPEAWAACPFSPGTQRPKNGFFSPAA